MLANQASDLFVCWLHSNDASVINDLKWFSNWNICNCSRVVAISMPAKWRCFLDPPSTSSWVVKTVHCCLPGLLHGEVVRVAIRDGNFTSHWWGWIWRVCSSTRGTAMKFKSHCQTWAHKSCLHCLDTSNLTLKLVSLDACQRGETLCKHFLINTVSIPYSNQWVPQAKTTD